jgi:hypothetical protein
MAVAELLPLASNRFPATNAAVKPRILVLSFSAIRSDPRVMRQVRLLEGKAKLTVAGYGAAPDADCDFVEIVRGPATRIQRVVWTTKLLVRAFESYLWNRPEVQSGLALLANRQFDLVIANDVASLPLALKVAGHAPVLADAHEYSPKEFDDVLLWRLLFGRYLHYLCRTYLPQASAMTTVCTGIANAYRDSYGVPSEVIYNAPEFVDQRPSEVVPRRVRMVHHGAAIRSRHLEVMIDLMDFLDDRYTLDFMLVQTDPQYVSELRRHASRNGRIRFVDPVQMENISHRLNEYDMGLFLLPPSNFNYLYALPNKLFEFIQARLAVAVGPSPEMARIVDAYSLGIVAKSFAPRDMATALLAVTEDQLQTFKSSTETAAKQLSFEESGKILLTRINTLLAASR